MSRRPGNTARRLADSGSFPLGGSTHKKSQSSPLLSIGLVLVVCSKKWLSLAKFYSVHILISIGRRMYRCVI